VKYISKKHASLATTLPPDHVIKSQSR